MAALLLLVGTVLPAFAEGATVAPDADDDAVTIGYDASLVEEVKLDDIADIKDYDTVSDAKEYKITDVDGYKKFVEIVNTVTNKSIVFSGVTIYLADDIDLSKVENQQPIGYYKGYYDGKYNDIAAAIFGGTLDGQGHEITGINVVGSVANDEQYVGFFGWAQNATIKNIRLFGSVKQVAGELTDGKTLDACGSAGIVACAASVTFYNVYSDIDVDATTVLQSAGYVGRSRGDNNNITNCTNMGDINGGISACAGGFLGFSVNGSIACSLNGGTITGANAGGFIARSRSTQTIINCVNVGDVTGKAAAGGFLGAAEKNANVTIQYCTNYGTIAGVNENTPVGAIFSGSSANGGVCTVEDTCEDNTGKAYIPDILNPTEDYCGYSSARIEKVDTTQIPDIKNIVIPDTNKEPIELEYKAYKITDVEGFNHLDKLLSNYLTFTGITIYLANDVDFTNVDDFSPIGAKVQGTPTLNGGVLNGFRGTFDGLGHMVKGVSATKSESNYQGANDTANFGGLSFFAILEDGAVIQNLIIEGEFTYTADPHDHGCVAGFAYANKGTVRINNCLNLVKVNNKSRFSGGFVARAEGTLIVMNSTNAADVWGCQSAGGIVGMGGVCVVVNCRNIGDVHCIKQNGVEHGTGTLVGSDHAAAGIVAWATGNTSITSCINDGAIYGVDNVAGIVGEIGKPAPNTAASLACSLEACLNFGTLTMDDPKDLDNSDKPNTPLIAAEGMLYAETNHPDSTTVDEYSADLRGTFDPTVGLEVLKPDFTPEADFDPTVNTTEAITTATPTTDNGGNNGNSTTAATTTGATTATPTSTTASTTTGSNSSSEEDGGCGSTVIGGLAIILLVSGAAVTMVKKKED